MSQTPDHDAETGAGSGLRGFAADRGRRRVLGLLLLTLLVAFLATPSLTIYLDQRAEISALEGRLEQLRTGNDQLRGDLKQWEDPEHVKQQARERLQMVEPGDQPYQVVGADAVADQAPGSSAARGGQAPPAWADALWSSVLDAAWPQRVQDRQADQFPDLGAR